jgi:hypothetical protein
MVFQDALGDYYFYHEDFMGDWNDVHVAKFRAPGGTTVSDFLKHYFRGGEPGVDMDLIQPDMGVEASLKWKILYEEQQSLTALRKQARDQVGCICEYIVSRKDKHKNLKLVK